MRLGQTVTISRIIPQDYPAGNYTKSEMNTYENLVGKKGIIENIDSFKDMPYFVRIDDVCEKCGNDLGDRIVRFRESELEAIEK